MATKSFIKTIGEKGLLADYNTEGKKLQTEDSIDQTYSSTSTKAQSGVAVNEAFKTRETSGSDDSYTYLGMSLTNKGKELLYWKLVSFKPINNYWTLQFEIDVSNGRKGNPSFDTKIYETKRLTICGYYKDNVYDASELRYVSHTVNDNGSRGYGNNIYYEMDSSNIVTVYIYAIDTANKSQLCRLKDVINLSGISNITWHEATDNAGTQPTNPVKFKEVFPAIASTLSNIGSDSVPAYINKGKPVSCNSSNLKAGKDDDGNVIKNTYATKTELNAKQNSLTAGDNITIEGDTISSDQVFVATYGTTKYAEVKAAYDAGKICTVSYDNHYFYMMQINSDKFIRFAAVTPDPTIRSLTVNIDNKWSYYTPWLQSKLTFDTTPSAGSKNPVTSDGIKKELDSRIPAPTSTTGTQVLKCIDGVIQWVTE